MATCALLGQTVRLRQQRDKNGVTPRRDPKNIFMTATNAYGVMIVGCLTAKQKISELTKSATVHQRAKMPNCF